MSLCPGILERVACDAGAQGSAAGRRGRPLGRWSGAWKWDAALAAERCFVQTGRYAAALQRVRACVHTGLSRAAAFTGPSQWLGCNRTGLQSVLCLRVGGMHACLVAVP